MKISAETIKLFREAGFTLAEIAGIMEQEQTEQNEEVEEKTENVEVKETENDARLTAIEESIKALTGMIQTQNRKSAQIPDVKELTTEQILNKLMEEK